MEFKRILIVQPGRLGDVVFSLPTLAALRKRFPKAHIAWLIEEPYKEVIAGNPYLNEVIVFERPEVARALKKCRVLSALRYLISLVKRLRRSRFDLALDLQGLFKSGLLTYLSGARHRLGSPGKFGMKELSYLFSKPVPIDNPDLHTVDRHLQTVRYLGGQVAEKDFTISVSPMDEQYIENLLRENNIKKEDLLIALSPTAGWRSRHWFKERFARVADKLIRDYKAKVIILGSPKELDLVQRVTGLIRNGAVNLAGKTTIKQLVALLKRCHLFMGNDSGSLHLAAAVGVPSVAIFGPTDPQRLGPYGDGHIVLKKDLPCSPCREKECKKMDCMRLITAEEVLRAAERQIERNVPIVPKTLPAAGRF